MSEPQVPEKPIPIGDKIAIAVMAIFTAAIGSFILYVGLRTAEIDTETDRVSKEHDERVRKWAVEDAERLKAAKEARERDTKVFLALLKELSAEPVETESYAFSKDMHFREYEGELPKEILSLAVAVNNRYKESGFSVGRPVRCPEKLDDFSLKGCRCLRVTFWGPDFSWIPERWDWYGFVIAVWDSKDPSQYAIGNDQILKFLDSRVPTSLEDPK